ncbi:MAG: polysaccharide deacetylase family protein [Melioribacteraceae bacterium]
MKSFIDPAIRIIRKETYKLFKNSKKSPIVILLYHRVTTLANDFNSLAVSPDNFYKQMKFIKMNLNVASLSDNFSNFSVPTVMITFDDGYADNYYEALPILREFDIPATIFINTNPVLNKTEFWWDELEDIILDGYQDKYPNEYILRSFFSRKVYSTHSYEDRKHLFMELQNFLKQISFKKRNALIEDLLKWTKIKKQLRSEYRSLTVDELAKFAQNDIITIGAHSVSHCALSSLSNIEQKKEILESKRDLERIIKKPVTLFSYPFGNLRSYNLKTIKYLREAGFIKAVSNFPGACGTFTDPYQLPRNLVKNKSMEEIFNGLNNIGIKLF